MSYPIQKPSPRVSALFHQAKTLLRLVLVSPASSCEVKRSFSALRQIKTWLLSTMTQKRLDNVMMCHIHRELLMTLDPEQIAKHFISGKYSKSSNSLRTSISGAL